MARDGTKKQGGSKMITDILKRIWPEWELEEKPLGRGSYGVVYKAVRRDHGVESYAAIKVISIPADPAEVDSLRSEGLDMNATRTYLQGIVNDFVSEIQLMESLKGIQNIVSVEDYKVVEKADEIGWDIFIRMELLTPFNTYICDKTLPEAEVIKLGCDICTALEICGKRNIIHRDIKPENIFINDFGDYKLGDFGIARKMENLTGGLSQKGTFNYMAPEVANCGKYDARVDTYSLGIVLYRLLNDNRLPFLNTDKQLLNPNERRNAVEKRLRGEALPAPCNASPAMADLILHACAFDPASRFASAAEMKSALLAVSNGTYEMKRNNLDKTTAVRPAARALDATAAVHKAPATTQDSQPVASFGSPRKKKHFMPIFTTICIVIIIAIIAGIGLSLAKVFRTEDGDPTGEVNAYQQEDEESFTKKELRQISEILSDAEELREQENIAGALDMVQIGLSEFPESKQLQAKKEELEKDLEKQIVNEVLEEAAALAATDDFNGASAKIQEGLSKYPESAELLEKRDEYKQSAEAKEISAILNLAEEMANQGDFAGALAKVETGLISYPGSSELAARKEEYTAKYDNQILENTLAQAASFAESGDYIAAINVIKNAQSIYGDNEKYNNAYNSYCASYKAQVISDANTIANSGDYIGAVNKLKDASVIIGNDVDLNNKAKEFENLYVAGVVADVDKFIEARDFVAAESALNDAMGIFPSNQQLKDKMVMLEDSKPKNLLEVCPPYETLRYEKPAVFYMAGNSYEGFVLDYESYVYFNLEGKYSFLELDLGHIDGTGMASATITFYLDGKATLIVEVKADELPKHIIVPLNGAAQLKISLNADFMLNHPKYGFSNLTLFK